HVSPQHVDVEVAAGDDGTGEEVVDSIVDLPGRGGRPENLASVDIRGAFVHGGTKPSWLAIHNGPESTVRSAVTRRDPGMKIEGHVLRKAEHRGADDRRSKDDQRVWFDFLDFRQCGSAVASVASRPQLPPLIIGGELLTEHVAE